MSDVFPLSGISGLSFDSPFLSHLIFLPGLLAPFWLVIFLLIVHFPDFFFPENFQTFFIKS